MNLEEHMEKNKFYRITFRIDEKEYANLKRKCELAHCKSMSAYIRRMALYGILVVFPEEQLKKMQTAIGRSSSNINQIALRLHSTNQLYEEDIADLKKSVAEMNQQLCNLILQLAEIHL